MDQTMTVNGRVFHVVRLLGRGKGGYSYLVTEGERYFVLKQIHHEPCDYYQFGDKMEAELRDYQRLHALDIPMPQLLDADPKEERILKEYIEGETILDLVLRDEMRPEYFEQVEELCRRLYAANTNIDYFPTNFVVRDGVLFYVDFECNDYMEQWDFAHWGIKYWSMTPELREWLAEHRA